MPASRLRRESLLDISMWWALILAFRRSTRGFSWVGQRTEASPLHRRVLCRASLLDPRPLVLDFQRRQNVGCADKPPGSGLRTRMGGDADHVVPYDRGRAVFDAASEPKTFITIRGAGTTTWSRHGRTSRRRGTPSRTPCSRRTTLVDDELAHARRGARRRARQSASSSARSLRHSKLAATLMSPLPL